MPVGELLSTTFEGFIQEADPGAVGANMVWFKPSNGALKFRDAGDASWVAAAGGGGGTGTVTNTGTLTANRVLIGNGGVDLTAAAAITAARALVSDANGVPVASVVTTAELAFVSGVTSGIQAQLDAHTAAIAGIAAPTFTSITSGTNTAAAMVVGTGASLATSGSGTIVATSLSATLAATAGGTGQTVYAVGDLLYANTTTTLNRLADVAVGSYLRSTGVGVAPVWSTVTLPNAATTGDLLSVSASNTYANIAAVAAGQVLTSAGTGTLPAWSATPTVTGITTGTITITQGTIVADAPQISGTVTWNAAGIVGPAWKLNVTDTSSNAAALLADLQIATVSKWKVDKTGKTTQTGVLLAPNGAAAAPAYSFSGATNYGIYWNGGTALALASAGALIAYFDSAGINFGNTSLALLWSDASMRRAAAATIQFGAADVNGAAVAQTLRVQSAVTGTDQNGADWTFDGSKQTGAGTPGNIIFRTSPKLASGTTQGTPEIGLKITGPPLNMHPSVVIGNQALATTATDGFLYIPTCAGTPTGVPTAFTGRVALVYDTTNFQFWIYDGAWKQPKTPAGAALVTWQ